MTHDRNAQAITQSDRGRASQARSRRLDGLSVLSSGAGDALHADRRFAAGEPVFAFKQVTWLVEPDAGAVEHPCGRYFFDPVLAMAAPAREPNCRIAADLMVMIARRDIARGERITYGQAPKRRDRRPRRPRNAREA
jgi:hypothetical protein